MRGVYCRRASVSALLSSLVLVACPGKPGTGDPGTTDAETTSPGTGDPGTTDAETTSTGTGDPGTTDAETTSHDNCPDCAAGESCSVSLCPSADYVSDGPVNAEFVGAVTCALEALRDGQPGRIRWTDSDGVGIFETYGYLELFGDGSARRGTSYIADFCYSESDHIEFGQLQLAMYFTDCLADPDIMVRYKCIEGALATPTTVCQVGTKACVEG